MMKLSVMRDFLHSPLSKEYATAALKHWEHDENTVKFIRASSNFVFYFKQGESAIILRLTPSEDSARVYREIEFLTILAKDGLNVNKPVKSLNGNDIEPLPTQYGFFQAVVLTYSYGNHLDIMELNDNQLIRWGEAMGRMHKLSQKACGIDFSPGIQEMLIQQEYLPLSSTVKQEGEEVLNWLNGLERTPETYGHIHYDFELDNIIWQGESPSIIDFESGLSCWFAADVAFALRDIFQDGSAMDKNEFKLFLEGYRKVRSISIEEVGRIPMFLRVHNFITYLKLKESMDVRTESSQPEWLNGLISKLERKLQQYEQGFKTLQQ